MQMQQQQPPVFKPLNSSEGSTSLFSFDSSRSRTCQNNNATFQIARPNEMQSQATKISQQKEQNIGQERLSSLHAKLHQEADKIRKWKVQSEIELKQKEKKIQEASTTVESLRKSILDLQLQNENLSLKLKEEMDHREDILNKIHCTRDLCNILKTHTTHMEEKLEQCETEKTELKYLGKEHQEQFEELSKQFQKLELSSVENHNKLMNQLNLERDERVKVEKDMEDKLSNAEEDLKNLIDQCDEKDIEIREVRSRLQKNDETIHTYEQDIEISKQKVENLNTELSEKDIKLQGLFDELTANLEEKNVLEIKINNIEIELQDSKSTIDKMEQVMSSNQTKFDTSINVLQRELESTRLQLEQTKLLLKEMEVKMVEGVSICENLKSSRDILIMEKSELEARISQQEHTLENIQSERDGMREELHRLQTQLNLTTTEMAEKCIIFEELQAVNKNLQDRINDFEISSKIMENTIQTQKKHLDSREEVISEGIVKEEEYVYKLKEMNMETEQLHQKLNKECDINEELKKSLKESKAEGQGKEKDLVAKEKEINKLKKEMEKQDKEKQNLPEEIEAIQEDLSQLRIKQEILEQEIIQLTQENDRLQKQHDKTDKNWNNERETKTKKMSELESKQKELKSDIVSKNKQIKELEKELKTTKSKLTTQTKSAEDSTSEIEKMSKEFETLKTTKIDLEEKLQAANNNEVKISSKLKTELADIKNQLHQAVKDKTDSIGRSDAQIAEMMATLQKYKMENQKIVDQKEKELDSLRTKLDQSLNVKEKNSKLCDDLKKETDELKKKIDNLEKEKKNLSQSSNSDSKKIKELQSKLDKKEKEIKELTAKVSTSKEKAESQTICTQTSPKPIQKIFKEDKPLKITYGFTCSESSNEEYGIMMYHKNRLIKAFEKVGYQKQPNDLGVGVVGVVEVNFLQPIHNKQDFNKDERYNTFMSALAIKTNEYWNEKKSGSNSVSTNLGANPDWLWAQCDNCLKWRRLPDGINRQLPDKWYCYMNPDASHNRCEIIEEPEDEDLSLQHASYQKTFKREMEQQKRKTRVEGHQLLIKKEKELIEKEEKLKQRVKTVEQICTEVTSTQIQERKKTEGLRRMLLDAKKREANQRKLILELQMKKSQVNKNQKELCKAAESLRVSNFETTALLEDASELTDGPTVSSTSGMKRKSVSNDITVSKRLIIKKEDTDEVVAVIPDTDEVIDLTEEDEQIIIPDPKLVQKIQLMEDIKPNIEELEAQVGTSQKEVTTGEIETQTDLDLDDSDISPSKDKISIEKLNKDSEVTKIELEDTKLKLEDANKRLKNLQNNVHSLLSIIVPGVDLGEATEIETIVTEMIRVNQESS